MGVLDMSSPLSTKNFFDSPTLSLSLAGIFREANVAAAGINMEAEEGDKEGGGGGDRREGTVEISSENSGPARSRSEDDFEGEGEHDDDDDEGDGDKNKNKKRKRYHRHTAEQIREMEALFKESPHPDEKQRKQLSKQLGLASRQVKFWFQNRRTQNKAIQERHENSLLKAEMEKLREENIAMKEAMSKACCSNCGFSTTCRDSAMTTEEQQLRIENSKLKAEVEKLLVVLGKCPPGTTSPSSCSAGNDPEIKRSSLDFYTGIFGLEESRIMEIVNQATEELKTMATAGEPLWIRGVETGREILNYDEYMKEFFDENLSNGRPKRSIEASREAGVVFVDLPRLVQSFMDVNQWKEMFPSMISKAATVGVIYKGEGPNRNGEVQLMFAELQMLTPMVSTREVYFVRYCKQLSDEKWAIIDVSIDKDEDDIDAPLVKCRKRPSGMYRTIVNSGIAFGARHWMATLQLQCELLVFFMATNVPTKDSSGVATLAGRKSILKLAQRMTWSFCQAIGASSHNTWTKVPSTTGEDIRVASRKKLNDLGESLGIILCAASSVWLPVSPHILFDFLRDEARWNEWDVKLNGGSVQSIANLAKGQDHGNAVTIQKLKSKENSIWILQDCCTNGYESMVIYSPVDITSMQSVMTGCDSSNLAIMPSGFSILPDGLDSRPLVSTSRQEEKKSTGGSLLTMAFQILTSASPTAKLSMESVDSVKTLISCTLRNIKTSLKCEDC